ncbi:MAG: hypothetical protein COB30_002510 [Ectothiorhodospiraceae bacterium]|nr:hypothetical protein [Ectothiorhodospiraceae bacterium]
MKKKIVFGGIGGIFLIYVGLMFYDMTEMEIEVLILCSENQGGILIPSSLCHYYMLNYRINEKDIKKLSEGAGLDYVLNVEGRNSTEYELAKLFLANGLDVNSVNHYKAYPEDKSATPLQAAAVYNDAPRIKFLIEQGADLQLRGEFGMTALEYAKKTHKAGSKFRDNREIIQLLSDAEKP